MEEGKYPEGWMVVDHVIPGVTEEMIDWWWVNMEKGYELWCPDEHKGFKWEVPPPLGGHIGAVQIATESIDYSPVRDIRIEWVDPNLGTPEQKDFWTYGHLLAAGGGPPGPGPKAVVLSHQWEAIPGGCKMRSCMHGFPGGPPRGESSGPPPEPPPGPPPGPMPPHPSGKKPTGGGWPTHNVSEVSTFKNFLPALWGIWQAVPDPAINRQASLKIKKEGSKIIYI